MSREYVPGVNVKVTFICITTWTLDIDTNSSNKMDMLLESCSLCDILLKRINIP
jgi:hypothetical protein